DGVQHGVSVKRGAVKSENGPSLVAKFGLELLDQLGFSNARFPSHDHDLPIAILGQIPVVRQQFQLLAAANQGSADLAFDRQTAAAFALRHAKQAHGTDILQIADAEILVGEDV